MPPNGGFGGNTGVHDAHNLAWKLAMVLRGGDATVQRGKDPAKALRDMDLLRDGDIVLAGKKEPISLVFLDDGHAERIATGKRVTLSKSGCSPDSSVEKVARKSDAAK